MAILITALALIAFFVVLFIRGLIKSHRYYKLEPWERDPDTTRRTRCYLKREYLPEEGDEDLIYVCRDCGDELRWIPEANRYFCPDDLLMSSDAESHILHEGEVISLEHEGVEHPYLVLARFILEEQQFFYAIDFRTRDPRVHKRFFFEYLVKAGLIRPIGTTPILTI